MSKQPLHRTLKYPLTALAMGVGGVGMYFQLSQPELTQTELLFRYWWLWMPLFVLTALAAMAHLRDSL